MIGKRHTWPELTVRERLRFLPLSVRFFLAVLLVSFAYPGLATLHGAFLPVRTGSVLGWSSKHLPLVWSGAATFVVVALLLVEPPRSFSARAYLAQLDHLLLTLVRAFERDVGTELDRRRALLAGTGQEDFETRT